MEGDCASTKSSCGQTGQQHLGVATITKEELQQKLRAGGVQVVNVLEPEWYKLGMILGSKKIPLASLERRLCELDKSREVVTYCANSQCTASREAARFLAARGFAVRAYEGGIKEWKEASLPVENAPAETGGGACCG